MIIFGCPPGPQKGHYFRNEDGMSVDHYRIEPRLPEGYDGEFAPKTMGGKEMPQGVAKVTHVGGWTVLAFWDRSGDSRPNSNSGFWEPGEFSFDEMMQKAHHAFPRVIARFPFPIIDVETLEVPGVS